jgi:hypothetical protein
MTGRRDSFPKLDVTDLRLRGVSIERERDGSYSLYFSGRGMYATKSGFKSAAEAMSYLDAQTDKLVADIATIKNGGAR